MNRLERPAEVRRAPRFAALGGLALMLLLGCLNSSPATAFDGCRAADLTGDGRVDVSDLGYLGSRLGVSDPRADLDGSGLVDEPDLALLRGSWSLLCTGCAADLDGSGVVDGADRALLEAAYGTDCRANLNRGSEVDDDPDVDILDAYLGAAAIPGTPQARADLTADGWIDIADLMALIAAVGTSCQQDLNVDGHVDTDDLWLLLASWGDCPVERSPTLGWRAADLDGSGFVDGLDQDLILTFPPGSPSPRFDLDGSGAVEAADVLLVEAYASAFHPSCPRSDLDLGETVEAADRTLLELSMGTDCRPDLDRDGTVTPFDAALLSAYIAQPPTMPNVLARADLDDSGSLDHADLALLQTLDGRGCQADASGDGKVDTTDLWLLFADWGEWIDCLGLHPADPVDSWDEGDDRTHDGGGIADQAPPP